MEICIGNAKINSEKLNSALIKVRKKNSKNTFYCRYFSKAFVVYFPQTFIHAIEAVFLEEEKVQWKRHIWKK